MKEVIKGTSAVEIFIFTTESTEMVKDCLQDLEKLNRMDRIRLRRVGCFALKELLRTRVYI